MTYKIHPYIVLILLFGLTGCNSKQEEKKAISTKEIEVDKNINLLNAIDPIVNDSIVNAIIEIPVGTLEKWETNKTTGEIERDSINGKPRTIKYIGYPGNYGMIPKTLLSKEDGGDGDPLDILVIGPPVNRGDVLKCKIIGVLNLEDGGENDDKIIGVSVNSDLFRVNDIEDLKENYNGVTEIIETWFTNYKGKNIVTTKGFKSRTEAIEILEKSLEAYQTKH